MNIIISQLAEKFKSHAERVFPEEACGLVLLQDNYPAYLECENVCAGNKLLDFEIDDKVSDLYEDNIIAVFHSHTNGNPRLTACDKEFSEGTRTPYIMYCYQSGTFDWYRPKGIIRPLLEREYVGGAADCYGLVRDYYFVNLGISLPNFYREDKWWLKDKNYINEESFKEAGFINVFPQELKEHDVVVMKFSGVNDHLGVYIGGGKFMHHAYKRLSKIDHFSGSWKKSWVHTLRHRSLIT